MKSPLNVASLSPVAAVGRAQGTAATETDGSSSSMDLLSDDFVTFAQRITLHDGFTMRDVSATVANLRAYEPTLFALAAAASAGGALPETVVKRACLAASVLEVDEDKEYDDLSYDDIVASYGCSGELSEMFEKAATKVLGTGHGISLVLQRSPGSDELAMYLVQKKKTTTHKLGVADVPVDKTTLEHFRRLCAVLGLEADGKAGRQLIL